MAVIERDVRGPDVVTSAVTPDRAYVDWGAIVAGTVVAMAISTIFLAFGSAVGLSLTSINPTDRASFTAVLVALALWLMWVQLSGLIGGAYVTGRLRKRIGDAKAHEVSMRDGMHGLIMWGLSVVIGAFLAAWVTSHSVVGLSSVGATAAAAADYEIEWLIRKPSADATQQNSSPQTAAQSVGAADISKILMRSADFTVDESDKVYISQVIAARTGLPEAEARSKLDESLTVLSEQAERARRMTIFAAFLGAATLLVGALASWWAATTGGSHRDENIDHSRFYTWR
jgi:hypothetical protein